MCEVRQGPSALKALDQSKSSTISTAPAAKPATPAAAQSGARQCQERKARGACMLTSLVFLPAVLRRLSQPQPEAGPAEVPESTRYAEAA